MQNIKNKKIITASDLFTLNIFDLRNEINVKKINTICEIGQVTVYLQKF